MIRRIRLPNIIRSKLFLKDSVQRTIRINGITSAYSKSNFSSSSKLTPTEVQIPIPYGKLTGKAWGQKTGNPVLALHGLFDNCGTFDRLIPLLPQSLYIVAIDLPGHGTSSHKPPGCFYSFLSMMVDLKRVLKFFGWEQPPHMIGHSSGGELALLFASLFPNEVNKLVIIDTIKPTSVPAKDLKECFSKAVNENLKLESKISQGAPVYTEELATKRLIEGTFNEIDENNAKVLMKRGIKLSNCGEGYIFTRDLKMRTLEDFNVLTHEALKSLMTDIKNEILLIKSTKTSPKFIFKGSELDEEFISLYQKSCKNFEIKKIDENHFSHLNNPHLVSNIITDFLCT